LFSFFIFTELDIAQPRRRTRVQSILFNIFSELARRLIIPGSAKTTLLAASLPNEQRIGRGQRPAATTYPKAVSDVADGVSL
jgi:hypothetical protein